MKVVNKVILLSLLYITSSLYAQLPVGQLFLSMPDSLCPYLDMKQRVVLLEYANQNLSDSVDNIYGGHSSVTAKTDNYLCIQVTDGISLELLTDSDSFCLIQTACAPICSSIVKRYFANWMFIGEVKPVGLSQAERAVFIKAEVSDGNIVWHDETPLWLDEEEKKHY